LRLGGGRFLLAAGLGGGGLLRALGVSGRPLNVGLRGGDVLSMVFSSSTVFTAAV
jgi:hypothetical protein